MAVTSSQVQIKHPLGAEFLREVRYYKWIETMVISHLVGGFNHLETY